MIQNFSKKSPSMQKTLLIEQIIKMNAANADEICHLVKWHLEELKFKLWDENEVDSEKND